MFEAYSFEELKKMPKPLYKYMWHFLMIIGAITVMTTVGTKEDKEIRKKAFEEYLNSLKEKDLKLYKKFRKSFPGVLAFGLPGYNLKSFASRKIYCGYQKKLKLG
jgi:hypothetical protein